MEKANEVMAQEFAEGRGSRIQCLRWGVDVHGIPGGLRNETDFREVQGREWGCEHQQGVKRIPWMTKGGNSSIAALEQREQPARMDTAKRDVSGRAMKLSNKEEGKNSKFCV